MSLIKKILGGLLALVLIVACLALMIVAMPNYTEVRYVVVVYQGKSNARATGNFSYNISWRGGLEGTPTLRNEVARTNEWTKQDRFTQGRVGMLERVMGQNRPKLLLNVIDTTLASNPGREIILTGVEVECRIEIREKVADSYRVVARERGANRATCEW